MTETDEKQMPSGKAPELETSWENPPSLQDLNNDYINAKADHDAHVAKIDEWLDNLHIRGKAKVKTPEGRSKVQPKLIRKQAEWRYAALTEPFLSTENIFTGRPATHLDKLAARQNTMVLNNQFNTQINKTKFIDEWVRSAVDEGTAIVRVGWDFQEETVEQEVPDYVLQPTVDPGATQQMMALIQQLQQNPEGVGLNIDPIMLQAAQETMNTGVVYIPRLRGYVTEEVSKTIVNQPTIEVCDFRNVIIDPTCQGDMDKAKFVIYKFKTSLDDLNRAGIYSNLEYINKTTNSVATDSDFTMKEGSSFDFDDDTRKNFIATEYWGYWDIDGNGTTKPIIATYVGDVMIRLEENPFPDGKPPFEVVQYLPVRKAIAGEPDGALLEDNQKIAGAVTRGMVDLLARSANGQVGSRADALDYTNREKFQKGENFEYNASVVDPNKVFHMFKFPEIPNSAPMMLQLQNQEAESLTGVRAFAGGISGEGLGEVAAGIRGALDAASKRELGILRRLSEGLKRIARRIIAMNGEWLSEEEVVRVTDEEFEAINREDLAGKFDLVLDITTAEADNAKAQELAFMLQTSGSYLDQAMSLKILAEIARLRKMPALAKEIESYQPQPDPLEVEKAQLEIELLKMQIAEVQSKTAENYANAQYDQSRVESEVAKADKLRSEADLNKLDFVETETGTKQERELQRQGEQARANMKLKAVEKALNTEKPTQQ